MKPGSADVTVQMPSKLWNRIVETLDSAELVSIDQFDDERGEVARQVDDLIRAQVPWRDRRFPPFEEVFSVSLSAEHWRFVLAEVTSVNELALRLGDLDVAAEYDESARLILAQLDA